MEQKREKDYLNHVEKEEER